jgi:ribosomal protein S18 acetylase RimI-like enzyme
MDERARATAFMARLDDRSVERLVEFRFGVALFHDRLPLVHDLNYLRVTRPADARGLAEEAERLQQGLAHRFARVEDEAEGERLARALRRRGWQVHRHVVMVRRRPPDRPAPTSAEEVSLEALVPFWEESTRLNPWGKDEEVVRQLVEDRRVREGAVEVRHFAARANGAVASSCDLYLDGDEAQVEMVQTLPAFRGRGLARSVVLAAVAAADEAGAASVYLVTDAEDWPRHLYSRLGFDAVGLRHRFVRSPA